LFNSEDHLTIKLSSQVATDSLSIAGRKSIRRHYTQDRVTGRLLHELELSDVEKRVVVHVRHVCRE